MGAFFDRHDNTQRDSKTSITEPITATMELSILSLSHPYLHPSSPTATTTRDSNASTTTTTNPALLTADLSHYRDLFTKLRFSYVEQVTKERFLRALVANPPDFTDARENAELAESLKAEKEVLRAKKEEVRGLMEEMETQGRGLVQREFSPSLFHPYIVA